MIHFRVCPQCASAKVDAGDLVGDVTRAVCSSCGWVGKYKDLIKAGAREDQMTSGAAGLTEPSAALAIANEVSIAYLNLLARHAGRSIGMALVQSGVVGAHDPYHLARLIRASCRGAHKATLDEIEKIQKELREET